MWKTGRNECGCVSPETIEMPSQAPQGRGRKRRALAGVFPGASQAGLVGSTWYSNLPTLMGLGCCIKKAWLWVRGRSHGRGKCRGAVYIWCSGQCAQTDLNMGVERDGRAGMTDNLSCQYVNLGVKELLPSRTDLWGNFWLLINVEGSRALWAAPSLGRWAWAV